MLQKYIERVDLEVLIALEVLFQLVLILPMQMELVSLVCAYNASLYLIFDSFVHSGRELKRRKKIYPKPTGSSYAHVKEQNNYLIKTIFDGKGNYLYHRYCVKCAFGVSTSRLTRLRKVVQQQSSFPFVVKAKEHVSRYSDIVLPLDCDVQPSAWLQEQPDGATVVCRNKLTRHGNSCKISHNAKTEFIEFVDMNSAPNGRKEGSHGATYYFNPKFSMI